MAQPSQTENDAAQRVALRVDQVPDLDAKVIQLLQDRNVINGPPADIETTNAISVLLAIFISAGIEIEDFARVVRSWDDAGKDLDIIRQCVSTSKFQPALEYFLNKTRIPASFRVDPGYINLSFIRHGESQGNTTERSIPDDEDGLSERGREQARYLGKEWANVRIDALYTSPYLRAKETAQLLAEHNHSHPEVKEGARLVEHDLGPVYRRLMEEDRFKEADRERIGENPIWGLPERKHCPTGGESLQTLVHRGIYQLQEIVLKHAVALPVPPEEMNTDYKSHEAVDELVENVPHVVIVAHNIFLTELWEALGSWNEERHVSTDAHFPNAGWSRHLLKFQGYGSNKPEKGYYALDFSFEVLLKDLRLPFRARRLLH
ncbi:histidine phosphatase superfamily [Gautieria morchelliformis]|nr:histidine phosphatase superfamily [Gautieria morchelliformis]